MTQTPDFIPWPVINERYNWAARDDIGRIMVFETRPELLNGYFAHGGHWQRIDTLTTAKAGTCEWHRSLQSREDWDSHKPGFEDLSRRLNEVCDDIKKGFEALSNSYGEMARQIRAIEERTRTEARRYIDSGLRFEALDDGSARLVIGAHDAVNTAP